MARPQKQGLDYFPFDVDFFHNRKIRILKKRYGSDGVLVYLYLLCECYKNGYSVKIDDDFLIMIEDDLNLKENSVGQIMQFLLKRSLLNEILLGSDTYITSAAVQHRFQEACKGRKRTVTVMKGLWLISKEETLSFIKVAQNPDFSEKNPDFSEKNADKSRKNATKESKGKESKIKEKKDSNIYLLLNDNSAREITEAQIINFQNIFKGINIRQELEHIREYFDKNPSVRKSGSELNDYLLRRFRKKSEQEAEKNADKNGPVHGGTDEGSAERKSRDNPYCCANVY